MVWVLIINNLCTQKKPGFYTRLPEQIQDKQKMEFGIVLCEFHAPGHCNCTWTSNNNVMKNPSDKTNG